MGADLQLLVFELDGTRFALPVTVVDEVVRAVAVEPLPGAPAVVDGIFDMRGEVVPLLDVRGRFGLAAKPLAPSDHFVIGRLGGRPLALRSDRAMDLIVVSSDNIHPGRALGDTDDLVAGIARTDDGLIIIHDLAAFLEASEAAALASALTRSGPGSLAS